MNRLKNILILTTALAVTVSCEVLDSQTPQQSIAANEAFSSTQAMNAALTGSYADMQGGASMGADFLLHSEFMADNANFIGSFTTFQDIAARNITVSNGTIENMWSEQYEVINDVNLLIEGVRNSDLETAEFQNNRDRIVGEALAIRGLIYFELVRLWARPWNDTPDNSHLGVVLQTEGAINLEDFESQVERSTVAEVYSRINTDLNDALGLLQGQGIINNGRFNEYNVRAILARVRLQQGEYQDVANLTDQIIQSNVYALEGNINAYFENEEASSESVFEIIHNVQDNPGVNAALSTFYAPTRLGGRGDVTVTTNYITAIQNAVPQFQRDSLPAGGEVRDDRFTEMVGFDDPDAANPNFVSLKYPEGSNTDDNAPVMRYADVLLMNAEAKARLANDVNSVPADVFDNINDIRLRSMQAVNAEGQAIDTESIVAYEASDFSTKQELIDAILLERRVELAFEGQRKHDLARTGQLINGDAPNANNVIFPIPQEELDVNDAITQNPGYGGNDPN